MATRWSREEPQFFNVYSLDWEQERDLRILHGLDTRLLSRDLQTGAATFMARLPPGWQATEDGNDAGLEAFVLEGDLSVEGLRLGAGGFAALPREAGECELSTEVGAQVYVFSNPGVRAPEAYGGQLHATGVWQEQWVLGDVPGLRNGRLYKPLRIPDTVSDGFHGGPGGL